MYNPRYERGTILDGCSYKAPTEISHSVDTKVSEEGAYRETRSEAQSPIGTSCGSKPMGNVELSIMKDHVRILL